MLIGIDGNEANVTKRVGVSWYVYFLLKEINKTKHQKIQVKVFLKDKPLSDLPKQSANFQYVVIPKKTLWSQFDLPIALSLKHRDLKIFLSPAHYAPRFCPCPSVVIVHDLSYFYYPQDFLKKDLYQLQNWTSYTVKQAVKIIAVSECTKNDLIKNYNVPQEKISVIYNGFSKPTTKSQKPSWVVKNPYFINIGTLQPRKNLGNLILGFTQYLEQKPDYYLYIIGKKGWLYDELFALVKKQKIQDRVIFTDYLKESEKWWLLENAKALILPGFYEGFGLPVLEAFYAGIPVIISRSGALVEIAKDSALLVDPLDPKSISMQLSEVEKMDIKNDLVKKGKQRLKFFSWQKTTKEILNTCISINSQ